MSMRLVKQQLAALSKKATGTKARKERRSKKKQPAVTVKNNYSKEAAAALNGAEVRERNLKYFKKSMTAEKSAELMMKVLHTQQVSIHSECALLPFAHMWTLGIISTIC